MKYFDDFEMGEKIITKGRSITESDIVLFAAFSGDWHQLHTDIEFAKKGPFGERIAHGFLVLAISSGLMPLGQMAVLAFYGMDKVRFLSPTKIGDTIRVEMEVAEKQEKNEKSGVVSFLSRVKNQKDEDLAILTMKVALHRK
ncbi:MAG: MaoC/PaaZ C-terminal domain-containing protein [Desulfatiglans sp.]|jgi:acyl dehydratase|nr:MaoC/PaaZ C-terminal domain-containing protein [Thermodesulfobacteriota bacterium]MEE4354434.1 MaoC/PaaZ C-terminal domain-containing protein [Desulfatiglans sp.]